MKRRRSRLALIGMLALAISVTVGLMAGSADAKKKGKKKGAKQVTVSKSTPTAIPAGDATTGIAGVASVPLTVGKKAKGMVVNSVAVTYQLSDPAGFLDDIDPKLIAPNGRRLFIDNPAQFFSGGDLLTVMGPLTTTPNSATGYCFPNPAPPPPGCPSGDLDDTLGPPFAGTAGDVDLALFTGVGAKGTWQFKALNFSTETTHVLNSVRIQIGLQSVPKG
jgi:hypothetical protein